MRKKSFDHKVYDCLKTTAKGILVLFIGIVIPLWAVIDTIQQLHGVFLWTFIPLSFLILGMCYYVCFRPFRDGFAEVDNHYQRPQS